MNDCIIIRSEGEQIAEGRDGILRISSSESKAGTQRDTWQSGSSLHPNLCILYCESWERKLMKNRSTNQEKQIIRTRKYESFEGGERWLQYFIITELALLVT